MLYIIGTGLNDGKDISLRSLEILRTCDKVFQECYTCVQAAAFSSIEDVISRKITMADRRLVEERDDIVEAAKTENVAFLVAGTPFFATTHIDLFLRAREAGVETVVIHNTSIMNVKGCYGLYSYSFGKTISIPYFTETWRPTSFYDHIYTNWTNKMHTLCLLDIKTDEGRFMTANVAVEQLLYCEKELCRGLLTPETRLFAICRFATDDERVVYDTAENIRGLDLGGPLHSLIVPAELDRNEQEFVEKLFPKK